MIVRYEGEDIQELQDSVDQVRVLFLDSLEGDFVGNLLDNGCEKMSWELQEFGICRKTKLCCFNAVDEIVNYRKRQLSQSIEVVSKNNLFLKNNSSVALGSNS